MGLAEGLGPCTVGGAGPPQRNGKGEGDAESPAIGRRQRPGWTPPRAVGHVPWGAQGPPQRNGMGEGDAESPALRRRQRQGWTLPRAVGHVPWGAQGPPQRNGIGEGDAESPAGPKGYVTYLVFRPTTNGKITRNFFEITGSLRPPGSIAKRGATARTAIHSSDPRGREEVLSRSD